MYTIYYVHIIVYAGPLYTGCAKIELFVQSCHLSSLLQQETESKKLEERLRHKKDHETVKPIN